MRENMSKKPNRIPTKTSRSPLVNPFWLLLQLYHPRDVYRQPTHLVLSNAPPDLLRAQVWWRGHSDAYQLQHPLRPQQPAAAGHGHPRLYV